MKNRNLKSYKMSHKETQPDPTYTPINLFQKGYECGTAILDAMDTASGRMALAQSLMHPIIAPNEIVK